MRCVVWPRGVTHMTDTNPSKWILEVSLAREVQKLQQEWYGERIDDTNSRQKCGTSAFAAH